MSKPKVQPAKLLAVLEPWLEQRMSEWHDQPAGNNKVPTLPVRNDGALNGTAVIRALIPLDPTGETTPSDTQHLYKKEVLAVLNAAAEAQGLGLLKSRAIQDADDAALGKRIQKTVSDLSNLQKVCAEQAALIEMLRSKVASLEEKLRLRDETGMIFRGGL